MSFLVVAAGVFEGLYRSYVVSPELQERVVALYDDDAGRPLRANERKLDAAFFTWRQLTEPPCSYCFSPEVLSRVERVYTRSGLGTPERYFRVHADCPTTKCESGPVGTWLEVVDQAEVEAFLGSMVAMEPDCHEVPIAPYSARICRSETVSGGEVHYVSFEGELSRSILNVLELISPSSPSAHWINLNFETGSCTYERMDAAASKLEKLGCYHEQL